MSPTVTRKLQGLLALAAALGVAGAGCTAPVAEDDDDIASAEQDLAPFDSEGAPDVEDGEQAAGSPGSGSPSSPSGTKLAHVTGPEPIPWLPPQTPPDEECDTPANPSPMTHGSGGPSSGSGGK